MTCGRVIGDKWEPYKKLIEGGKSPKEALDELGLKNYCCRSIFLSHVDLLESVSKYKKA